MWGGKKAPRPREETGRGRTAKTPTRGWMREGGGAKPRCGKEGAQSTARGRWLGAGGWRGQAPEATRMCGGSSHRRIAADEGQWANGGEGGSKTCGRHVDGSGAEAGKESTTRRQAGVGLSTHGGLDGQGLLGTLTSSIYAGGGRGRAVGRKALQGSGRGRLKNTSLGFRGDGQTTEPNVQLSLFGCKSSKMRDTTGIRTTAHSVLLFKSPLIPKEGATWSLSELKVGNFRNFAPPIHVLMWPVLRPNTNSEERHFTKLLVFS
jgi:hypothetical protein